MRAERASERIGLPEGRRVRPLSTLLEGLGMGVGCLESGAAKLVFSNQAHKKTKPPAEFLKRSWQGPGIPNGRSVKKGERRAIREIRITSGGLVGVIGRKNKGENKVKASGTKAVHN